MHRIPEPTAYATLSHLLIAILMGAIFVSLLSQPQLPEMPQEQHPGLAPGAAEGTLAGTVLSCDLYITLPHELRAFARLHQKEVYGLLIKCAADSILKLAADPHYVGGLVGVMAVLHTWSSNLSYHLHVHCLVTGGGLSSDGRTWMPARDDYLVPVRELSRLFRGIFLGRIRRQFEDINLPKSIRQRDWVVHCKPAVQSTGTVLNYLARYIHRVAITNSRIISADNGKVTFRYKDSGGAQTKNKWYKPRVHVYPYVVLRKM